MFVIKLPKKQKDAYSLTLTIPMPEEKIQKAVIPQHRRHWDLLHLNEMLKWNAARLDQIGKRKNTIGWNVVTQYFLAFDTVKISYIIVNNFSKN